MPVQNHTLNYQAPEAPASFEAMKLEDYGALQARYHSLKLSHRAGAMLADAKPALAMAETILSALANMPKSKQLFDKLRQNAQLVGKMRPSDAKTTLIDSSADFLDITRKKLSAWKKTIERISMGEAIIVEGEHEYISSRDPLYAALLGICSLSSFLSIIQLAIAQQAKNDPENSSYYNSMVTNMRRCCTLISDCENAAGMARLVH